VLQLLQCGPQNNVRAPAIKKITGLVFSLDMLHTICVDGIFASTKGPSELVAQLSNNGSVVGPGVGVRIALARGRTG
jgi:hypothetical protein